MNVGGSIYILKGNFSLKLEKVLDPPFKGLSFLDMIPKKFDVLPQFCINCPMFGIIVKLRSFAVGC